MNIYRKAAKLVQKEIFACHAILAAEGKKCNQRTPALERFENMFKPRNLPLDSAWYSYKDEGWSVYLLSKELGLLFMAEIAEEEGL